jgi:hypothetical protein
MENKIGNLSWEACDGCAHSINNPDARFHHCEPLILMAMGEDGFIVICGNYEEIKKKEVGNEL